MSQIERKTIVIYRPKFASPVLAKVLDVTSAKSQYLIQLISGEILHHVVYHYLELASIREICILKLNNPEFLQ